MGKRNKAIRRQIAMGASKGLTPADIAMIRSISKKSREETDDTYMDKLFLYMLTIPLNVLVSDYWGDDAKDIAPEYIEQVIGLFEAVQEGVVSADDLKGLLLEYAGVKFEDIRKSEVDQNEDIK